MRLSGRAVLVTGGGGGLGRAMADGFAREGAAVAVSDVNLDAARSVARSIEERGGRALAVAMDVTSEEQVEQGVAETVRALGRLDVAVSNAGIQHIAPITEFALADWRRVLSIHLDGGFLLTGLRCATGSPRGVAGSSSTWAACTAWRPRRSSRPTWPPSTACSGSPGRAAKEGAKLGVRTNVICPGFVRTPLVEKQIPEQAKTLGISEDEVVKKVMLGNTVDGEFTTLQDIAQLAVDLAAFPSAALTGQLMVASHGWHMH